MTSQSLGNEIRLPAIRLRSVVRGLQLALNAGWDEEILAIELQALSEADLSFDMGVIGFSTAEIDMLIDGLAPEETGDPRDDRLPPVERQAVSVLGDLWILGRTGCYAGMRQRPRPSAA